MPKTPAEATSAAPDVAAAPAVEAITLTIHAFCLRLSETDKRPELIKAFEVTERAAGNTSDTAEKFQARYAKFINKPV